MYGPITQGEGFRFAGRLLLDDGEPLDGAGASAVLVFAPAAGEPVEHVRFQATGALSITDATTASYAFEPSSGDLANLLPGHWWIQAVATLASGDVRYSTPVKVQVNAPL